MTRPRTGFSFLDAGLDQPGAVLAFAHRGGAFHPGIEGLENTLVAFEHAVALGYRYLETDVHVSSDGRLLAFHDTVLDRVTQSKGAIAELTYEEIATALIGGKEQIPSLPSLLEHFPHARFNIDIKSDLAVEPLATLIIAMKAFDRVCIGSFSARRTRALRRLLGRPVATACSPAEVAARRFAPNWRLFDVLLRGSGTALQVPHRHKGVTIVTEAFVARAHAAGKPVHVWTIDDPTEMAQLLDLGIDGLMTDRTDLLRDLLLERGQWLEASR